MPGAVFQLKTKGPQDAFLTGTPTHNFIKQSYRQHKNFAIQKFRLPFRNQLDFGKKSDLDVLMKGDFIYKMSLQFTLPALTKTSGTFAGWTNSIGHAIIDYVDIEIGGLTIDRHYGLYLEIWNELTVKPGIRSAEDSLIGKFNNISSLESNAERETSYSIPLQFWFNTNIGAALPLINLQFHPVKLIFKMRPFEECIVFDGTTPPNIVDILKPHVLSEYIFIDDTERAILSTKDRRYLISQLQSIEGESVGSGGLHRSFLSFNQPCSEILWIIREQASDDNNDWFNFAKRNTTVNTPIMPLMEKAKLIVDNIDRTELLDERTLRLVHSNRYHTQTTNKHIYTIPLCNEPEKWYPTGTMNFSRIDTPELNIELPSSMPTSKIYIFAKNFNILDFREGMIQLGFST